MYIFIWNGQYLSGFVTSPPFSFGMLFSRHIGLFSNFTLFAVLGETLLPKGTYRPWDDFQLLVKN